MSLGEFLKKAGMVALGVAAESLPGGGLARDLVTGVLGVDPGAPDAEVIRVLEGSPDAILKLKALEQTHERELIALTIEGKRVDAEREARRLEDLASARSRDVAGTTAGGGKWRANIMLGLAFSAVVTIAVILGRGAIDAGSATAGFLYSVGGMFAKNIGQAFDFEFGSSRGSKDKDAWAWSDARVSRGTTPSTDSEFGD